MFGCCPGEDLLGRQEISVEDSQTVRYPQRIIHTRRIGLLPPQREYQTTPRMPEGA